MSNNSFIQRIKVGFFRKAMRLAIRFMWRKWQAQGVKVSNTTIVGPDSNSIALRIYTPSGTGPFLAIVYFHGGGFVVGDLDSHDCLCADLCQQAKHIVIAVDYRLAPEYAFPAAPYDCLTATQWAIANADQLNMIEGEVVVAGDSAGGNLAAVVALQAREKMPNKIKGQILLYPVADYYDPGTPSYLEHAKGQGLTRNLMIWFWDTYYANSPLLTSGQTQHPLSTPLRVDDLSDLPPALVLTAEKDPLRDEGVRYAEALKDAGVSTQQSTYKGLQHGFIGAQGPTSEHQRGIREICDWLLML